MPETPPTNTTTIVNNKKFDISSITKLNGENYRVWRLRMMSLFTTHKIMNIVDGTLKRPSAEGKTRDEWDQCNNEAFTAMILSMNDEEVESISSCFVEKSSSKVWQRLPCTKVYQGNPNKSSGKSIMESWPMGKTL